MSSSQRIVGGLNALAPVPWQVIVSLKGLYICGGTIIGKRTIVTAAHCLYDKESAILYTDPSDYEIRVSPWRHLDDGFLVEAKKIIPHENFVYLLVRETMHDDIAIIQLKEPLQFSEHISQACLPEKNSDPKGGTYCYVSGFGDTEPNQVSDDPSNIYSALLVYIKLSIR